MSGSKGGTINTTISGRESGITLRDRLSLSRWGLVHQLFSPDSEKLKDLRHEYDTGRSLTTIAEELGMTFRDVRQVVDYYEFPPQVKAYKERVKKAVDIDALAERLWLNIEPKVRNLIEEMIG